MRTSRTFLLALLAAAAPAVLAAGALPNLPKDKALPQGDGSPGVVTFRHASHVDAARPDCTTCHPTLFPIVRTASPVSRAPIRHAGIPPLTRGPSRARMCCWDGDRESPT